MICPECKQQVSERKRRCEACGGDLTIYKKTVLLSARFYNQGLECAKVRDLSGAIVLLKKSLEMNKRNTNARNLLGLVFFEMGETVAAISEWVLSKNLDPQENDAEAYIDIVQANSVKRDAINQAIRKYNAALEDAKQGTYDLAMIQVKKAVKMHPKFVHAMLLQALLHMKDNEVERAKKLLLQVLKIDVANKMALRYLAEVNAAFDSETPISMASGDFSSGDIDTDSTGSFMPLSTNEGSYPGDKPNVMVLINLIVGLLIGVAVASFLIVPTRENKIREEYRNEQIDYSEELNGKAAQIHSLETKIAALTSKNEELERSIAEAKTRVEYVSYEDPKYAQLFSDLFVANKAYTDYMTEKQLREEEGKDPSEILCREAAEALLAVTISNTSDTEAIHYYEQMCAQTLPDAAAYAYKVGKEAYDNKLYEDAIPDLEAASNFDVTYDRPVYYLGRCYQAIGNDKKAIFYYELLMERCPDSSLVPYATERLEKLKGAEN